MVTANYLNKVFQFPRRNPTNPTPPVGIQGKGDRHAVKDLTFHVDPGEIVGLIGPNGAGKSTVIRMLAGVLMPTSGFIRINHLDPCKHRKEHVHHTGIILGHQSGLWKGMPLIDSFEAARSVYGIPEKDYQANMEHFVHGLDLKDCLLLPVEKLSLGQRMRAEFACAMLHNPKLVLLDEPLIGLDAMAREYLLALIREVHLLRKTTFIISSHQLEDMERILSRVMVMDQGSLVYNGSLKDIRRAFDIDHVLELELDGKLPDLQDLPIKRYLIDSGILTLHYDAKTIRSSAILDVILKQCTIKNIKKREPGLEAILLKMADKKHSGMKEETGHVTGIH